MLSSVRRSAARVLNRLVVLSVACALAVPGPAGAEPRSPIPGTPGLNGDGSLATSGLRADGLVDPLGLENRTPKLSWQLAGPGTGIVQRAYQVRAASTRELLGRPDRWDSGRVESAVSAGVAYGGPQLASREQVWWQVRVWPRRGGPSPWSEPARFEAGLLTGADWSAKWIASPQNPAEGLTPVVIKVPEQSARYVRVDVSKLGEGVWEGFPYPVSRLQFSEIEVRRAAEPTVNLARGTEVTASESLDVGNTWQRSFLTDGVLTSQADPRGYTSLERRDPVLAGRPIWLQLDLGATRTFDQVLLYPRTDARTVSGATAGFPVDYTLGTGSAVGGPFTRIAAVTGQVPEPPYAAPEAVPLPVFATNFDVTGEVRKARLYATGLGVYAATVNGAPVSRAVLEPANTDFRDRVEYGVYDVTRLLKRGPNAIGMALGNGLFNAEATPGRYQKF